MDAVLLVGGEGTRLRPLTRTRHKSLVPVANRPALAWLLERLAQAGVTRAVLALGKGGEGLASAAAAPGLSPIPVELVVEGEPLGSGGAIRNAVRQAGVQGRFLVANGDVFCGFDLRPFVDAHVERRAELTIVLVELPDPTGYGVAEVTEEGWVRRFVEKPPPRGRGRALVNAGVWIFEPELVAEIPAGAVRVEETLFPTLVAAGRHVLGAVASGLWADLGTPERYLALHRHLLAERNALAAGVEVAPGAVVERSALGARCRVGAAASVKGSVLWEDVEVGAGAVVEESILADGVRVGEGAVVRGSVLGAGAKVAAGATASGEKLEPGEEYDGRNRA